MIPRRRLDREHVERSTTEMPRGESSRERSFVDERRASGVDEKAPSPHQSELFRSEKRWRAVIHGGMEAHEVASTKELVQCDGLTAGSRNPLLR